jgi:hypothetical protein
MIFFNLVFSIWSQLPKENLKVQISGILQKHKVE